jgi:hypothetical protein
MALDAFGITKRSRYGLMSDCCPEIISKQDPCWDGYVQRGMKEQGGKMVPNCVPSEKSDAPMDVANNPTISDPTPAAPNGLGMKRPQYMLNQARPTKPLKIHNKPGVDIWAGSAFGSKKYDEIVKDNPVMPTDTYQVPEYDGCGCETCMALNVNCDNCPVCGPTQVDDVSELGKSIFNLETAASLITKQTIRWDK